MNSFNREDLTRRKFFAAGILSFSGVAMGAYAVGKWRKSEGPVAASSVQVMPVTSSQYPTSDDAGIRQSSRDVVDPSFFLTPAENAHRQAVLSEFSQGWDPDIDSIMWEDSITVNSSFQLDQWLAGTAVSGIRRDVRRNQRLILNSEGDFSPQSKNIISNMRGLDYLSNGKTLLVEGVGATVTSGVTITGCRGIIMRDGLYARTCTLAGGDPLWTPGANTWSISDGGSGYTVGDRVSWSVPTSAVYENPVFTVTAIGAFGEIVAVKIAGGGDYGVFTSNIGPSLVSGGTGTNAKIAASKGVNPRDGSQIIIQRTSTFPLLPVVIIENSKIGAGWITNNNLEWINAISAGNCEQVYIRNVKLKGVNNGVVCQSVRRLKSVKLDINGKIGDSRITLNTSGNVNIDNGLSYNQSFADGMCFIWDRLCTVRNLYDDCGQINSAGKRVGLYLEHSDSGQEGTKADTGGYKVLKEFCASYAERETFVDIPLKSVRLAGGTQGDYKDDSNFRIDGLNFSCIFATTADASLTGWNGVTYHAYCTSVRTARIPPSGTTNLNSRPGLLSRKKADYTGPAEHHARKIVAAKIVGVSGSGYVAVQPTDDGGNVIVDPNVAGSYSSAFPGLFGTDAQGRMTYTFNDDGTETPAEFRQSLYEMFGRVSEGVLDPATWPEN